MSPPVAPRPPRGFTLIELVVVLVVLAVLAALTVPTFATVVQRSQDAVAERTLQASGQQARALAVLRTGGPLLFERSDFVSLEHFPTPGVQAATSLVLVDEGEPSTQYGELSAAIDVSDPSQAALALRSASGNCARSRLSGADEIVWVTITPPVGCLADLGAHPGDLEPGFALVANPADAAIELAFDPPEGASSFVGACWTAAMGPANPVMASSSAAPLVVTGLENHVTHTCQVTASSGAVSDLAQATPAGDTDPYPGDVPPLPSGTDPVTEGEPPLSNPDDPDAVPCPTCVPDDAPGGDPGLTTGLWDVASFVSHHAGAHQLFFVDRGYNWLGYVYDGGVQSGRFVRIGFRNTANTANVTFTEPAGLTQGAHPARSASPSTVTFNVLYLVDAATGMAWMLDIKAARAHLVASGLSAPTGVTWAACADAATGATTSVAGASQCLYVSGPSGITRVPLLTAVDANGSLQPTVATSTSHASVTSTAATKVFAAAALWSGDGSATTARPYTSTATLSATDGFVNASGATFIPASVTGAGDLVVVADAGDHRIKTFDPTTPGVVQVIAGSGQAGFDDGVGVAATFWSPRNVHFHGNWPYVYVADTDNGAIRKLNVLTGATSTVFGPFTVTPLTLASPGDSNGLFSRLGGGHVGSYTNPVTTGAAVMSATVRSGQDARRLTDRDTATVWAALSGDQTTFDLGPTWRLEVSAYTLRTGSDAWTVPSNWSVQGSLDGVTWADLDVRSAASTVINTWYTFTPNTATGPVRFLRLVVTGPAGGFGQQFAELEFYGALTPQPRPAVSNPFTAYGDTTGLFATLGGADGGPYTNPAADGTVVVSATGTAFGVHPLHITDRVVGNTGGSSRWGTGAAGGAVTWDLGPQRSMRVDSYTVFTDHQSHTGSFTLEGSTDGVTWTALDTRPESTADRVAQQFSTWYRFHTLAPASSQSWRYLRLDVSAYGAFAEVEFYGNLTETAPPPLNAAFTGFGSTSGMFALLGGAASGSYTNPVTDGTVGLVAVGTAYSSVPAQTTDRTVGTNNGWATGVSGGSLTWDLGASRSMQVTDYVVRTHTGAGFASPVLSGSNDGTTWSAIDDRTGDTTATTLGAWYRYYPTGSAATGSWRYLRLALGPYGALDEIEFHGQLTQ
jgi:prepilin-type N-terminal cleavage/methylation domain-containing protein